MDIAKEPARLPSTSAHSLLESYQWRSMSTPARRRLRSATIGIPLQESCPVLAAVPHARQSQGKRQRTPCKTTSQRIKDGLTYRVLSLQQTFHLTTAALLCDTVATLSTCDCTNPQSMFSDQVRRTESLFHVSSACFGLCDTSLALQQGTNQRAKASCGTLLCSTAQSHYAACHTSAGPAGELTPSLDIA